MFAFFEIVGEAGGFLARPEGSGGGTLSGSSNDTFARRSEARGNNELCT